MKKEKRVGIKFRLFPIRRRPFGFAGSCFDFVLDCFAFYWFARFGFVPYDYALAFLSLLAFRVGSNGYTDSLHTERVYYSPLQCVSAGDLTTDGGE